MSSLEGHTILVTRATDDAEAWAVELAARGARAVVFPCIASEPLRDADTERALAEALDGADWLALTSVRGVQGVAEILGARGAGGVAVAAVGDKTATAARRLLGGVDLVAPEETARSLADALAEHVRDARREGPMRVVVAGAASSRRDLEEHLEPLGVEVRRVTVYRTVVPPPQEPREDLATRGVDTIFLASPSAVAGLLARASVPAGVRIITIGPSTSAAARGAGLRVHGEAAARGLEGMIEAMS
jgi:uroporphyrinogen-III synthase